MRENIVEAPKLEIDNNILRYGHSVIQLSNVSRFSIGPIPPDKYPLWAILGVLLSFPLLFVKPLVIFAIIVMAVCVLTLIFIYQMNLDLGKYLIIEMNGGNSIFFTCWSEEFLNEVEDAMVECFNKESVKYKIDLKECRIDNIHMGEEVNMRDSYVVGDRNVGNITLGSDNVVTDNVIQYADDWEKAAKIFSELVEKYFGDSEEVIICKKASEYCKQKDAEGLKDFIWRKENIFREILFRAASTGICEILKNLIGIVM